MAGCGGSWLRSEVQCPFYRFDDGKRKIVCEGITERGNISQGFGNKRDFLIQVRTFCCNHYKNCEIYNLLMNIYKDD